MKTFFKTVGIILLVPIVLGLLGITGLVFWTYSEEVATDVVNKIDSLIVKTTTYELENSMSFSHILESKLIDMEEFNAIVEQYTNNEVYNYKGFELKPDEAYSSLYGSSYTNDNFTIVRMVGWGEDENSRTEIIMVQSALMNEIKLIDGLKYEQGKEYELVATPEYLDEAMKFECIEKTDTTIKFKSAICSPAVEYLNISGTGEGVVDLAALENVIEITINEEDITIKSLVNMGDGLTETSTNTITLGE